MSSAPTPFDALRSRADEACLNGWPAVREVVLDAAVLRLSGGYTRRANSVNLLGPIRREPADFIRACENVYDRGGLPTIFRLSSAVPGDLGPALEQAGFGAPEDETLVLRRDLRGFRRDTEGDVSLTSRPIESGWLDALAGIQGLDDTKRDIRRLIIDAIAVPAVFAATQVDGQAVALAFGALHDGMVCINSVATHPDFRRRGFARRAIGAVLAWAAGEGRATDACIPVVAGNHPAVALCRGLGFEDEVLRYHYRRRPDA
ncbi:MAG TPA: GNAT family N-acetyltransferase [Lichenihabitans sp.]|nr:GNAT family N-acetyltransferase [Lichenihabitans sp.]